MKLRVILLITAVMYLSGCYGDEMFEIPDIVSVVPEKDCSSVLPDAKVVVEFSKAMDTVKTNGEFSLSSSSGNVDGLFSWDEDGKTLTFTPRSYLNMAEVYTIRITGSAEDREGNDLNDEFLVTFYTGGDLGQPGLISYTPAANSTGNSENSTINITFSEPISLASVYEGVNVSPAVEGSFTVNNDGTVVTFIPRYGFRFGVTYSVNITERVEDESGNNLLAPSAFRFTVGDDFSKPSVTAYQNLNTPLYLDENIIVTGAEKDRTITLDFSEEIKTDKLQNAVSISPAIPFYINASSVASGGIIITRAVINFTANLSCEENYTLRINSTVSDRQDNPLDHDYRFVFKTDGPASLYPAVTAIGDMEENNSMAEWPMGEIPILDWGKSGLTGLYDNIGVDFSSEMDPSTIIIQVENVAGQGGLTSIVNIDWPTVAEGSFLRVTFGLYKVYEGNTYKIVVKGGKNGLKDLNGNYMKEDFIQLVRF